jgi:hypothetical protein
MHGETVKNQMYIFKFTAYNILLNVDYKIVINNGSYLFVAVRICKYLQCKEWTPWKW